LVEQLVKVLVEFDGLLPGLAAQRVVHAAGCCHAVQTFRVHPLDWLRRLSAVVAWLVGLRLVSEPPL